METSELKFNDRVRCFALRDKVGTVKETRSCGNGKAWVHWDGDADVSHEFVSLLVPLDEKVNSDHVRPAWKVGDRVKYVGFTGLVSLGTVIECAINVFRIKWDNGYVGYYREGGPSWLKRAEEPELKFVGFTWNLGDRVRKVSGRREYGIICINKSGHAYIEWDDGSRSISFGVTEELDWLERVPSTICVSAVDMAGRDFVPEPDVVKTILSPAVEKMLEVDDGRVVVEIFKSGQHDPLWTARLERSCQSPVFSRRHATPAEALEALAEKVNHAS